MLGSLLKLGVQWAEKQKPIVVHQEKCTHSRHKASTCNACLTVCPVDAIDLKNGVQVDWDCISCGLCTSVCPTDSLQLKDENLKAFYTKIKKVSQSQETVFFHCRRLKFNQEKEGLNEEPALECLGQLDEVSIQLAVASGVKSFYFLSEECSSCSLKAGHNLFSSRLETWKRNWPEIEWQLVNQQEYLAAMEKVLNHLKESQLENGQFNRANQENLIDRRQFFKYLGTETKQVVVDTMVQNVMKTKEETPWKEGQLTSQSSIRLQVYHQWIKPRIKDVDQPFLAFPVMSKSLHVSEQCTFCEICEKVCPTQALHVESNDKKVIFDQEQCIDCHLCEDVCYRKAITFNEYKFTHPPQ